MSAMPESRAAAPWYSFATLGPDSRSEDAGITSLSNDVQARHYAQLLVRELRSRPGYRVPGLRLIVRNDKGEIIHDLPF